MVYAYTGCPKVNGQNKKYTMLYVDLSFIGFL